VEGKSKTWIDFCQRRERRTWGITATVDLLDMIRRKSTHTRHRILVIWDSPWSVMIRVRKEWEGSAAKGSEWNVRINERI
jgi:hypothetical protein